MKLDETLKQELSKLRTDEVLRNKDEIVLKLSELLVNAVKSNVPKEPIGIAFSGGVDSTLLAFLCDKLEIPFILYSIGFVDSKDMIAAKEVAKEMNWKLKTKIITLEECENIFKKVIDVTKKRDIITVGVGAVTYSVLEMMEEEILLTGLGSEELFAGYDRHKGDINEECWKGLLDIWNRDLTRDVPLAKHFDKEIKLPFLEKGLVEYAMKICGELKVGEFRKQILREAAVSLGLREQFAFRKKLAAQYGSKFDFAIQKLAKKKGLKKKEYLEYLN